MGEIKRTLDLVMERTRHLSLSDEERVRQRQADFRKRLQGLLQQYADGALSVDNLRDRIASLQTELAVTDRRVTVAGIVQRLDPDQDNHRWLDLLDDAAPALRGPLEEILAAYSRGKQACLQKCDRRMREHLASRHGITGSAVAPNPLKDDGCRAERAALRQQFEAQSETAVRQAVPADQT